MSTTEQPPVLSQSHESGPESGPDDILTRPGSLDSGSSTTLNLVLIGPPGAGKGTQAAKLCTDFDLPYIGSGDLLRQHRKDGTDLGKKAGVYMDRGELPPDDLVIAMILDRIEQEGTNGFLLDGFPRTLPQAAALETEMTSLGQHLTAVLSIELSDELAIKRLSGRRQCRNGHLYHIEFDPPKHEGVCDQDGTRLCQREDDQPETIKQRLAIFHAQTAPLIDLYEKRGLLRRFDGSRSPTEVHDHIRATLATLRLEERL